MQLKMVRLADLAQTKHAYIMCGFGELPSCTLSSRLRKNIVFSCLLGRISINIFGHDTREAYGTPPLTDGFLRLV